MNLHLCRQLYSTSSFANQLNDFEWPNFCVVEVLAWLFAFHVLRIRHDQISYFEVRLLHSSVHGLAYHFDTLLCQKFA